MQPKIDTNTGTIQGGADWVALELYYELGDGVWWNSLARQVGFRSRESAILFKRAHPEWHVTFQDWSVEFCPGPSDVEYSPGR